MLAYADLNNCGISTAAIKQAKARQTIQATRACKGRPAEIIYDSLPGSWQQKITEHFGEDPYRIAERERSKKQARKSETAKLVMEDAAKAHYETDDYNHFIKMIQNGHHIDSDTAYDYAMAAAWLRLCSSKWYKKAGFTSKNQFYQAVVTHLADNPVKGLKVSSVSYLRRRIATWKKNALTSIADGRVGNTNRQKITDEIARWLIDRYAEPIKISLPKLHHLYNMEAQHNGWPLLSSTAIDNFLNKPDIRLKWYYRRHGEDAFRQEFERSFKRKKPSFPDALWSLDGSALTLIYQDENGKPASDLYIYYAQDVHSDALIGYQIGTAESATLVQATMRNACRQYMYHPLQLQYDNSSANKSGEVQQLFENLASRYNFPCEPYNGKGKYIENLIGRFEQGNLRHFRNFRGGNITAKTINAKANPEYLNAQANSGDLPTKQQAIDQLELAILVHNNTVGKDGKTPLERYLKDNDQRKRIEYLDMVELFWVKRRQPVKYSRDGLTIQVDHDKYTYEVQSEPGIEDRSFRDKYIGDKFDVYYDPDDMDQINLYQDGKWIATADRKYEFAAALVDRPEGEGTTWHKAMHERKRLRAEAREQDAQLREELDAEGVEALGYKHIHKDALNRVQNKDLLDRLGLVDEDKPKSRKRTAMYDGGEASGEIIDFDE